MFLSILTLFLVYLIVGIVLICKQGWGESWQINVKLFLMCGLGWPIVLLLDKLSNDSDRKVGP